MRGAIPVTMALTLSSLLLVGCAGGGRWSKEGAPPEQISADYAQCRAQAQHDIARDVNIDTDIAAGRDQDWQHNQSSETHLASDASSDARLSDNILNGCMEGKGYTPSGDAPPVGGPNWLGFLSL
ncbi:MAG TPA: hypothetical protein VIJ42_04575 [Stellaceae bacterium]